MRMCKPICVFILLTMGAMRVWSQLNFPPSAAGIGRILSEDASLYNAAPGLAVSSFSGLANNLPIGINYANPASYSGLTFTNFDVGLQLDNTNYSTNFSQREHAFSNARLSNIHLGIPIKANKIGLVIGMYPYSQVGYNLSFEEAVLNSATKDFIRTDSKGSGGSYYLHTGLGYKINDYINLGFNIGYLWGSKNSRTFKTPTQSGASGSYFGSLEVRDLFFGFLYTTVGAIATVPINSKKMFRIGASFSLPLSSGTYFDGIIGTTTNVSSDDARILDTVLIFPRSDVNMRFPYTYAAGISFLNKTESIKLGIQYKASHWGTPSEGDVYILEENRSYAIQDDWRLSVGLQLRPGNDLDKFAASASYFSFIAYSLGGYYGKSYLQEKISEANDVNEFGVSLGFLFPLKRYAYTRQFGGISLNLLYGVQGLSASNAFRSTTFTIRLGFSLGDIWFLKRKFD